MNTLLEMFQIRTYSIMDYYILLHSIQHNTHQFNEMHLRITAFLLNGKVISKEVFYYF